MTSKNSSTKSPKTKPVPKTLGEAIATLDYLLPVDDKLLFTQEDEDRAVGRAHNNLGRHIRNIWRLSQDRSPLNEYFNGIGIRHADDMSGIILRSFYRTIKGQDIGLDGQVKVYQDFWNQSLKR